MHDSIFFEVFLIMNPLNFDHTYYSYFCLRFYILI